MYISYLRAESVKRVFDYVTEFQKSEKFRYVDSSPQRIGRRVCGTIVARSTF